MRFGYPSLLVCDVKPANGTKNAMQVRGFPVFVSRSIEVKNTFIGTRAGEAIPFMPINPIVGCLWEAPVPSVMPTAGCDSGVVMKLSVCQITESAMG